jgi:hypothetical protein
MTTSPRPCARYTGRIGATGRAKVRTISGLPAHLHLGINVIIIFTFGFQTASENFGKKRLF